MFSGGIKWEHWPEMAQPVEKQEQRKHPKTIRIIVIHRWLEDLVLAKIPEVLSVQPIRKTRATFNKKKVTPKFIDERYIKMVIYSINNAVN